MIENMPKIVEQKPSVFAKRLAELRKSRQLTQQELAQRLGLSLSTVAYYEATAKNPKLETVYKLAEFFGVRPASLIEEPNSGKKPGPASRLDQLTERISHLSAYKQRMLIGLVEAFLNSEDKNRPQPAV
jgi:transcriptional regulator with XRE-family HTH domain